MERKGAKMEGSKRVGIQPPFPKRLYPRKLELTPTNLHLVGPPEVGKTSLVFHFLKYRFKGEWTYIDFQNPRYSSNWEEFEKVELAIIDNYLPTDGVVEKIAKRRGPTFLISSPSVPTPAGFIRKKVWGLDWEEFLLAYPHLTSSDQPLTPYLQGGAIPGGVGLDRFNLEKLEWRILERLSLPRPLVVELFSRLGEKVTRFSLFKKVSRTSPLSKDRFYGELERLKREGVLFEVPKWKAPHSPRKYFSYNPSFKLLFLETKPLDYLIPAFYYINRLVEEQVFYTDLLTFYIPARNLGVICSPFPNWVKLEGLIEQVLKEHPQLRLEVVVFNNIDEESFQWSWQERVKVVSFPQLCVE